MDGSNKIEITKTALLTCEGVCSKKFGTPTPTKHVYSGENMERPSDGSLNRILHFQCINCDHTRIWGNEVMIQPKKRHKETEEVSP